MGNFDQSRVSASQDGRCIRLHACSWHGVADAVPPRGRMCMANVAMRVELDAHKGGAVCIEEMASTAPISARFFREKKRVSPGSGSPGPLLLRLLLP